MFVDGRRTRLRILFAVENGEVRTTRSNDDGRTSGYGRKHMRGMKFVLGTFAPGRRDSQLSDEIGRKGNSG